MHRCLLPAILLFGCACRPAEPSACDGFADRTLAVSAEEYRSCAGEILAALDSIAPPLRAIVSNSANEEERDAARREYRKLRALIRQTGIEDDYRSMRPGTVTIKWPNGAVSAFNSAAFAAATQYMAVLSYPNSDNFAQGVKAHETARSNYRRFR